MKDLRIIIVTNVNEIYLAQAIEVGQVPYTHSLVALPTINLQLSHREAKLTALQVEEKRQLLKKTGRATDLFSVAQLSERGRLPGVLRLVQLHLLDLEVDDDLRLLRRRLTLVVAAVATRLLRDARLER